MPQESEAFQKRDSLGRSGFAGREAGDKSRT